MNLTKRREQRDEFPAVPSIHVTEMTSTTVRMPFITRLYLTCGHAMYSDAEPIKPQQPRTRRPRA